MAKAFDADPHLTAASTLSRMQFIDHIPEMLDTFERRLTTENYSEKRAAIVAQKEGAAAGLELESRTEVTTFRVPLPRYYGPV